MEERGTHGIHFTIAAIHSDGADDHKLKVLLLDGLHDLAELEDRPRYLNKACRAQIVVLTVNHTSLPLNEYAVAVFNKLGIGDNILNNGLLFVMAIDDDDYWLSTGGGDNGGISKLYPAEVIKHDYDVYLEDYFARKEYSNGAKSFFEALFWRVSNLYGVDIPYYRIETVYQQ